MVVIKNFVDLHNILKVFAINYLHNNIKKSNIHIIYVYSYSLIKINYNILTKNNATLFFKFCYCKLTDYSAIFVKKTVTAHFILYI